MSEKTCRTQNYTTESTNVLFEQLNRMISIGELAAGEIRFVTIRLTLIENKFYVKLELGGNNLVMNFITPYGDMQPMLSAFLILGFSPKDTAIIGLKPGKSYTCSKIGF